MLSESMLVTTVAVTDLERAKRLFSERLAPAILDETPFAIRFGAGKWTQFSVRRGQPNVGQTVALAPRTAGFAWAPAIAAAGAALLPAAWCRVTARDYQPPKTGRGSQKDPPRCTRA